MLSAECQSLHIRFCIIQNDRPGSERGYTMAEKENSKSENTETKKNEQIREYGQTKLEHNIHLLSVIGEIEGHECLSSNTKTTKYEHVLPQLAAIEDSSDIQGLLVLLNTVGGDVEAGLAIAEMIASSRLFLWYLAAAIRSVCRSLSLPIIPLLSRPERWSSIRSV